MLIYIQIVIWGYSVLNVKLTQSKIKVIIKLYKLFYVMLNLVQHLCHSELSEESSEAKFDLAKRSLRSLDPSLVFRMTIGYEEENEKKMMAAQQGLEPR